MLREAARQAVAAIAARGQTRARRQAHSATATQQVVARHGQPPEPRLLFCSNDYLGLASHPVLVEALIRGAREHGVGAGASHLVSGHHRVHEDLEHTLAQWFSPWIAQARALGFSTGYMANLAVITGLAALAPRDEVALFSDDLNHASLIDACRLSKCTVHRYPHGDTAALGALLRASPARVKLIVSDGVFSMDGDCAPVLALQQLAQEHDAWWVLDDAHGWGVLGDAGRGTVERLDRQPTDRLILVGTLGKAAGAAGAFVVAHEELIEALLQTARPYIYTTAAPPALAEAVRASLQLMDSAEGRERRRHLQQLIAHWQAGAGALIERVPDRGWRLLPSDTPIQALVVGGNEAAVALSLALEARGLWVPAIRPPTVPRGTARLRITFSAGHTIDDIDRLLQALEEAAESLP